MDRYFDMARLVSSRLGILSLYLLYQQGIIKKAEMSGLLHADTNNVNKVMAMFKAKGYASTVVDKGGVIHCVFNHLKYDLSRCAGCDSQNFVKKTVNLHGNEYTFKICSTKCADARYVKNRALIQYLLKNSESVRVDPVTKNEGIGELEQWEHADFAKYIVRKFKKKFPGSRFNASRAKLSKVCHEMFLLMHGFIGSKKSALCCKRHVDYVFGTMHSDSDFRISDFVKFETIAKTVNINTEDRKSVVSGNYCEKYGIDCSYFKEAECILERDNIPCDDNIRKYMKKKYS